MHKARKMLERTEDILKHFVEATKDDQPNSELGKLRDKVITILKETKKK